MPKRQAMLATQGLHPCMNACRILLVRRILAIIVLLLVPFQLAFAAGAEYCDMGWADSGSHLGHHIDKGKSEPGKKLTSHACAFCALGCAQTQASSFTLALPVLGATFDVVPILPSSSWAPPGFERPPRADPA